MGFRLRRLVLLILITGLSSWGQSQLLAAMFTLDGISYSATPTIIDRDSIAGIANPGQDISSGELMDVYFRTATSQFVLGIRSTSFDEVVFFDSPASGSGYAVNAGGANIASSSSFSLTEAADGDVIVGESASLGDFDEFSPFGTSFTTDFSAAAAGSVSRGTRGKLDTATDLFFSITGASFVGAGEDGIVVHKLSDTVPLGDYDTAVAGTMLPIADYGDTSGNPPGLTILSSGDLLTSNIHAATFQQYDYTGLNSGDGDFGLETGSFSAVGAEGNWNTLIGLTGLSQITGVASLSLGTNTAGQSVLFLVDRGGTTADGSDDRVFIFAQAPTSVPEPSSACLALLTLSWLAFRHRRGYR